MTVKELRIEIAKITGANPSDYTSYSKKQLVEIHDGLISNKALNQNLNEPDEDDNPFTEVETENTPLVSTKVEALSNDSNKANSEGTAKPIAIPEIGSPEWKEFVLGLLYDDEVIVKDGVKYPKAAGLRRVANKLLGPIVESKATLQAASVGSNQNTIVTYTIVINWMHGLPRWMSTGDISNSINEYRTFTEIAECNLNNTPSIYGNHPSATAATRAEGRALRKALLLNVFTADEIQVGSVDSITAEEVSEYDKPIENAQKMALERTCKRLGVSLTALLNDSGVVDGIDKCSSGVARQILNRVNSFVQNRDLIPDELKSNPSAE